VVCLAINIWAIHGGIDWSKVAQITKSKIAWSPWSRQGISSFNCCFFSNRHAIYNICFRLGKRRFSTFGRPGRTPETMKRQHPNTRSSNFLPCLLANTIHLISIDIHGLKLLMFSGSASQHLARGHYGGWSPGKLLDCFCRLVGDGSTTSIECCLSQIQLLDWSDMKSPIFSNFSQIPHVFAASFNGFNVPSMVFLVLRSPYGPRPVQVPSRSTWMVSSISMWGIQVDPSLRTGQSPSLLGTSMN